MGGHCAHLFWLLVAVPLHEDTNVFSSSRTPWWRGRQLSLSLPSCLCVDKSNLRIDVSSEVAAIAVPSCEDGNFSWVFFYMSLVSLTAS